MSLQYTQCQALEKIVLSSSIDFLQVIMTSKREILVQLSSQAAVQLPSKDQNKIFLQPLQVEYQYHNKPQLCSEHLQFQQPHVQLPYNKDHNKRGEDKASKSDLDEDEIFGCRFTNVCKPHGLLQGSNLQYMQSSISGTPPCHTPALNCRDVSLKICSAQIEKKFRDMICHVITSRQRRVYNKAIALRKFGPCPTFPKSAAILCTSSIKYKQYISIIVIPIFKKKVVLAGSNCWHRYE